MFRSLDPNNGNPPTSVFSNIILGPLPYGNATIEPLFQFTDFQRNATLSNFLMLSAPGNVIAEGSGLAGSALHVSNSQLGVYSNAGTGNGSWGAGLPAIVNYANSTLNLDGVTFVRSSGTINSQSVQNSGTLVYNGNIGANAQWSGVVSASSVSSCGTGSSVSGTWPHIVLTVGTGTPTSCTINLSSALSATPLVTIQSRQSGNSGWNASTGSSSIILGSAGFPAGTYDIIGILN